MDLFGGGRLIRKARDAATFIWALVGLRCP